MLLLAVLSVLFMLGLGFVAILYALADIDGRGDMPQRMRRSAEPIIQGGVSISHV